MQEQDRQRFGRYDIYTDVAEVNENNIIEVLQKTFPYHQRNSERIEFLLEYEAGNQPLQREKKVRKDIDIETNDNIANEITKFKLGYLWGNPITFIQRGKEDKGKKNKTESEAITDLNELYYAEGVNAKTQKLGRFVEICGIGYTFVDINNDWEEGDSYFDLEVLDPRYTYIVKSSRDVDHRPVLGVTYREDDKGNVYYSCFTKKQRFEVLNQQKIIDGRVANDRWMQLDFGDGHASGEVNPLGKIPIIEWQRSFDRMGAWEREIPSMDNLNILWSDLTDQIDQITQAIWHGNDVDFPTEIVTHPDGTKEEVQQTPKSNDWVLTQTSKDGKTPFIKPLVINCDVAGQLENITSQRMLILQRCNVPQRNDDSGGSTGVAMSDATGWSEAETEANTQQAIMELCKIEELKVVLAALKKSPDVPADSPLLKLTYSDLYPSIKRQKTYEMTVKTNAYATLVSHGIDGLHALKAINFFDDPQQVYEDSKSLIDKYQKSLFDKDDKPTQNVAQNTTGNASEGQGSDVSSQIGNSPTIDGNGKDDGKSKQEAPSETAKAEQDQKEQAKKK